MRQYPWKKTHKKNNSLSTGRYRIIIPPLRDVRSGEMWTENRSVRQNNTPLSLIKSATQLSIASQITESKLLCNYMLKVRQLQLCSPFYSNSCIITCKLVLGALITYLCEWHAEITEGQFHPSQITYSAIRNNKDSCTESDKELGFLMRPMLCKVKKSSLECDYSTGNIVFSE